MNPQNPHNSKNQNVSSAFWEGVREANKLTLRCVWKCKGLRIATAVWEKNVTGGLTPPDTETETKL